jgi:hypothetical protein
MTDSILDRPQGGQQQSPGLLGAVQATDGNSAAVRGSRFTEQVVHCGLLFRSCLLLHEM